MGKQALDCLYLWVFLGKKKQQRRKRKEGRKQGKTDRKKGRERKGKGKKGKQTLEN